MTDQKKATPKQQLVTGIVVAVVIGGLWVFKTVNPEGYKKSGLGQPLKESTRDDEYVSCVISAKKVYDASEIAGVKSPRYDYTFTCKAKQNVILSDIVITACETVTARNTGVGKDEKSERRLDSESVDGKIELKAGEQYEKTGRLARKSSIEGSHGFIEVTGRLRLLDAEGKAGYNPTDTKTFLRLKVPAA